MQRLGHTLTDTDWLHWHVHYTPHPRESWKPARYDVQSCNNKTYVFIKLKCSYIKIVHCVITLCLLSVSTWVRKQNIWSIHKLHKINNKRGEAQSFVSKLLAYDWPLCPRLWALRRHSEHIHGWLLARLHSFNIYVRGIFSGFITGFFDLSPMGKLKMLNSPF